MSVMDVRYSDENSTCVAITYSDGRVVHTSAQPVLDTVSSIDLDGFPVTLDTHAIAAAYWIHGGGTVGTYTPPLPSLSQFERVIQEMLDTRVRERGYSNIVSATTYVTSNNPKYSAEAAALVDWRDAVWTYVYEQWERVENSERTVPTPSEFLIELQSACPFVWPEI